METSDQIWGWVKQSLLVALFIELWLGVRSVCKKKPARY